jgi:hypothetical protein
LALRAERRGVVVATDKASFLRLTCRYGNPIPPL